MFADALEYLDAALERLDVLLHREILRLRATYELSMDEFRGLYISDEQVNHFIDQKLATGPDVAVDTLTRRAEAMRADLSDRLEGASLLDRVDGELPWARLTREFGLSPSEQDILLLALAPEIDPKYETIYAYLNNDVTRKAPTVNLALRLFTEGRASRRDILGLLLPEGTLFGSGLLRERRTTTGNEALLSTEFAAAPSVVRLVMGLPVWDDRLTPFARYEELDGPDHLHDDDAAAAHRSAIERMVRSGRALPLLIFAGRPGAGRLETARAASRSLGIPLLRVNLNDLMAAPRAALLEALPAILLQQHLLPGGLYLERPDALIDKEGHAVPEAISILTRIAQSRGPVILAGTPEIPWHTMVAAIPHVIMKFEEPDLAGRHRLWNGHLENLGASVPADVLDALAERFILNPGQIARAATTALDAQRSRKPGAHLPDLLFEAARAESGQRLGTLATKVRLLHTWDDLVLPAPTLRRVREIGAAMRHRDLVYAHWGFERRIAAGKGLKVLFTGTPGTGKTMTAGVIARDLALDLYKIDLSGIVSKYIGETEKNLDRIFDAAQAANAILFFDEADALFGKRSEVKDAHDRYANIETSYLLQKMEEHEGAVILATNLRKNIDEAFSRRMHYVIEFPMPDEPYRRQLWKGMFPADVPLSENIDFQFLARQFTISGGDIQNVALDAAFLAAQDGQVVTMEHLVNAMARQLAKQGRLLSASDFKQYHTLLAHDE